MSKWTKLIKNPKLFFYDYVKKRSIGKYLPEKKRALAKPKKSLQESFEDLSKFTQYYDVNSMKIGEEFIWPYIRNHLLSNLYEVSIGKIQFRKLNPLNLQNGHHSQVTPKFRKLLKRKYDAKDVEELDGIEADFLFFVPMNGFGRTEINGKIYHRMVDPFYEVAHKIGKALKIEVIKNSHLPAIKHWHNYAYKSLIILPPILEKTGYSQNFTYDKKIFHMFKTYLPTLEVPTANLLNKVIDFELHTRDFYLEMLQTLKPKVICLYGYHYNAPLISAADELGILTVDIQHGLQVGWGPIYNNFNELPISGYQSLPDLFAIWGEKEYKNIINNFNSIKHKPIYMGNPWLKKLSTFPKTISDNLKRELSQDKIKILIILQDQQFVPSIFIDIINTSSDGILWAVRHHPSCKNKFTTRDFSESKNILVDNELDKIRFNELFEYIDISISEGSSLSIESSYYGVENIITGSTGFENYKEEIKNGQFYFMENTEDFENILREIQKKSSNKMKPFFSDVEPTELLQKLLILSSGIKKNNSPFNFIQESNFSKLPLSEAKNCGELIHKLLNEAFENMPGINQIYNQRIDFYRKEAKIMKMKIQKKYLQSSFIPLYLIGDSLQIPRKESEQTTSILFNEMESDYKIVPWAQRQLTTTKLLEYWEYIIQDIKNHHFVLHLGIGDCSPRMFSENAQIAFTLCPTSFRKGIADFSRQYENEIFFDQRKYTYVDYVQFKINLETIVERLTKEKVKSITFINIAQHPELDVMHIRKFNTAFTDIQKKFTHINIIDINSIFKNEGYSSCILADNVHITEKGHTLLATELLKTVDIN